MSLALKKALKAADLYCPGEVMTVKIRAHHLFCMTLYEGKGYSRAFVSNMDRITEKIRSGEAVSLQILAEADCLCRSCPHLAKDHVCRLDQNCVKETDLKVIRISWDCRKAGFIPSGNVGIG